MKSPETIMNLNQHEALFSSEKREQMVIGLASVFHEKWRETRKRPDGSFEPRIKKTTDKKWIEDHGTDEVDIANTSFVDLPADWQKENKAAAEVAMDLVLEAVRNNEELNDDFIEKASAEVHDQWLARHRDESWVPETLKKPFNELPEEEKEKDRMQVREAIEIFMQGSK